MLSRHAHRGVSAHGVASQSSRRLLGCSWPAGRIASSIGQRHHVTRHPSPWRRPASESLRTAIRERGLATAVGDFKLDADAYSGYSQPSMAPFTGPFSTPDFLSFDPTAPLVIPDPSPAKAPTKMNVHGVPGDTEDMLPVFDACIRVGKLDRASLVLKRINLVGILSPEERILLHNRYLQASLQYMRTNPDRQRAEQLHKWYELQIRNKSLPHTAETIACMLKASLLSERGSRLTRLVTRYMNMAPGEAGLVVLSMDDILSDQDLAVITEICPTYNFAAEHDEFIDDINAQEADLFEDAPVELAQPTAVQDQSYPKLVSTPQNGYGLSSLRMGLELLNSYENTDIATLPLADREAIQQHLERDSIEAAIFKWRELSKGLQKLGLSTAFSSTSPSSLASSHMAAWLNDMIARLKEEFALIEKSENKEVKSEADLERCLYGPILCESDPSRLAAITILAVLNHGALSGLDKGIVVSKIITDVARLAQEDIEMQRKEKAKKNRRKRNLKYDPSTEIQQPTDTPVALLQPEEASERLQENMRKPWSLQIKAHLGSILVKSFIETARIDAVKFDAVTGESFTQSQPAFTHLQQPRKGKKVGVLYLNEALVAKLRQEPMGDFLAKYLPMVVQPKPWRALDKGGFLESKANVVRFKPGDVEQRLYTKEAIRSGSMTQVFKGLDVLGKTAWKINEKTFDVMVEAWNTGEEITNFPPLHPDLEVPPEPASSEDPSVRRKWLTAVKSIENERSALHSQRCYINLQLEVARAFRNQTFYFPHNVDYRGRAYPIPAYLNHMGADHARAILRFAEGRELGERGLRWVKIHLANVFGLDKSSFDEREAFANDNMENIKESATNPLGGSRWWMKAEDPWQCLSACFELSAAMELEDPTKYISHLPVHQDGTCNGLQHYAALGGDTWGAKQVNLEPGERPADVYSAVADLVKAAIAKDAEAQNPFALALNGKITRKVVKQTVMTNVYGVTFAGAKKQVCKQIDAYYPTLGKECGIPNLRLSSYIARHIFTALATMFRGAHDIQHWLGEVGGRVCRALTTSQLQQIADAYGDSMSGSSARGRRAKKVTKSKTGFDELSQQFRSTVVWTTPLRMPVAQPYRKQNTKEIRTCLQAVVYPVSDQTDPVNRRKQLQGFPPNFIHSLDASHMLLSALKCDELGLNFAAVHDSFWTHAADIDKMNGVIRDSFINIHEEDVVGRLSTEFQTRHKGSIYLAHINPDTPVAKKIKELRKKSKLSAQEELLLEHKRNQLRLSGNPWDLEAAKQIVTPASVYEDMQASEVDVTIAQDAADLGLGKITQEDLMQDEEEMKAMEDGEVADQDTSDNHGAEMELQESSFESNITGAQKATTKTPTKAQKAALPVWLPLTIPAIPEKGDFDVTRLRESKYFFS